MCAADNIGVNKFSEANYHVGILKPKVYFIKKIKPIEKEKRNHIGHKSKIPSLTCPLIFLDKMT